MYKIIVSNKALKEIDNLPDYLFTRIDNVLEALKENPRLPGSIKLTDIDGYRIRLGNYRLLYKIDNKKKEILIYKVLHRKDVYRKR